MSHGWCLRTLCAESTDDHSADSLISRKRRRAVAANKQDLVVRQTGNLLGVQVIGDMGIVEMNPAVGGAVFHAIGSRLRNLPILVEKLI